VTITLVATPRVLTWAHYTVQAVVVDPADDSEQDAYTGFRYDLPDLPSREVHGQRALATGMRLTITPKALVRRGATQSASLLAHEQFHYDVGIVIGRVVARELARLRAPDDRALGAAMNDVVQLHFETRTGLIQKRYDLDTRHGTNAHYQRLWKGFMRDCLARPESTHLHGFWL
jgi:hypothetical protein